MKTATVKCSYFVSNWTLKVRLDDNWDVIEIIEVISTDDIEDVIIKEFN